MRRPLYLFFGVAGYLLAVAPMVYFVAFTANLPVPKSVDSGLAGPAPAALAVDLALLLAFAVVHSVLARPAAKTQLARRVPAELVRSLYSAIAGTQIVTLMALWRPLPAVVWSVPGELPRAALWGLFAAGWAVVLGALRAVDAAHLFGLRQALAAARDVRYEPPPFVARGPYRYVRHPLYAATVLSLFAAPDMSQGRLLLALTMTLYIVLGCRFEERDLEREHGEAFSTYRAAVPAFLPGLGRFARR
ncbi:MAG: isoprenylcysteine carboxylmethyltransferase family protein [Thermoanaerobaculia bacterium]|nr:isoprenylcysteine carboxylmethyltransferase family protein [Thermoanaerobaculia bacterium]